MRYAASRSADFANMQFWIFPRIIWDKWIIYVHIYTDFTKTLRLDIQIFNDLWLIFCEFYAKITNLMQCVLQYNFFSRNENCCIISSWAFNKENSEKSYAISKISQPYQYVLEFVQIYFGTVKDRDMYLICETTHSFRFT